MQLEQLGAKVSNQFDPALVDCVLTGSTSIALIRSFVSQEVCRQLRDRFTNSTARRSRGGDISGEYIGTYHWGKPLADYFSDCAMVTPALTQILDRGVGDVWETFRAALGRYLHSTGRKLRPAEWMGNVASVPLLRSWVGDETYGLVPHEDRAQCSDPRQEGFEIQTASRTVVGSVNICLANKPGSGKLILWNKLPTDADRTTYGTTYSGGPYPDSYLADSAQIILPVNEGDLYIFNGALLHAVSPIHGYRLTASCLIAQLPTTDVVMWS